MKSVLKISFITVAAMLLYNCGTHPNEKSSPRENLKPVSRETSVYDSTMLESAFHKLKAGDTLSKAEILEFAGNKVTRILFYDLLRDFNKEALFPSEYDNFEKASESNLINWLLYPTELDTVPSAIELIKKINYQEHDTTFIYYVYRFKTDEPHWAAKDGWMIGVVGPYFNDSYPYDWTRATFSKFTKIKETTPEKEVEWIHKNVYRKSRE